MCEYGCNQPSTFRFRNGRKCCSKNIAQCPAINAARNHFIGCSYCDRSIESRGLKTHEEVCHLNPKNLRYCPVCQTPIKEPSNKTCSQKCAHVMFKPALYPWDEIQQYYNEGNSYTECQKRFGFTPATWQKSIRIGRIIVCKQSRQDALTLLNYPLSTLAVRRLVLKYDLVPYVCRLCNLHNQWQGSVLTLQLDHIDGNWRNNTIDNLRFLCPNCHSQTSTFGSKNMGKAQGRDTEYYRVTQGSCNPSNRGVEVY
jgi:hypothetical protein